MNNFVEFITPERAFELNKQSSQPRDASLADFRRMSRNKAKCQCGEMVWKYADCGLCFTCTTGEWDASGDYELIEAGSGRTEK